MGNDLMYRATDEATWDAWAAIVSLTYEDRSNGCYIDEIGPVVVTPAVVGPDGDITTPAVMDDRYHVNVRLTQIAGPRPDPLPEDYVPQGHDPAVLTQGGPGVEWIDPVTVNNPRRIWAGGMNYYMPIASEQSNEG
jgi:hypothetical protein